MSEVEKHLVGPMLWTIVHLLSVVWNLLPGTHESNAKLLFIASWKSHLSLAKYLHSEVNKVGTLFKALKTSIWTLLGTLFVTWELSLWTCKRISNH
jgi:hypothetical protein